MMKKNLTDMDVANTPLSESNVSLKLAEIQLRCWELLEDSDNELGLTLEDAVPARDSCNPYDRG